MNFEFCIIKRKILSFLLSLIIIVPALLPLLRTDFFHMHDFTHVVRLVELHRALFDGQVPARWSDNFGWGYGMPLLHFYAPLSYYLAEIPYLLGIPALWSIKLIFALNFLAAFWFMYWFANDFWGKWGGVLAAVAFVYAPYRAAQFYVRGTLAEMTAMTFLPLAFWGLYKLVTSCGLRAKKWILISSLGIAGVFLSHNVIALFSIPFLGVWALVWLYVYTRDDKNPLPNIKTWAISKYLMIVGVIVFGLTAWFLLPALLEKQYTVVDTIAGGYSFYKLHFIYLRQLWDTTFEYGGSILGPEDGISFQLGLAQIGLLGVSGIVFVISFFSKKGEMVSWFHGFMVKFSSPFGRGQALPVKLSKKVSRVKSRVRFNNKTIHSANFQASPIKISGDIALKSSRLKSPESLTGKQWNNVFYGIASDSMIANFLMGIMLLFSIFFMTNHSMFIWEAIPFIHIAQFPWRLLSFSAFFVAFMIGLVGWVINALGRDKSRLIPTAIGLIVIILIVSNFRFFRPEKYIEPETLYYTDKKMIQAKMSGILKDYIPIWMDKQPELGLPAYVVIKGDGEISNWQQKIGWRRFHIRSDQGAMVQIRTFYFPGWEAKVDSAYTKIGHENVYGFMEFHIPAGEHEVEISLKKTPIQLYTDWLALITWGGVGVFLLWKIIRRDRF